MNKKYIIYIIMVIVLILISIIFKTKEKDINSKVLENIKTISKETAIKVLKLEYGDFIDINCYKSIKIRIW